MGIPPGGWLCEDWAERPWCHLPTSLRIITALRAIVNDEYRELVRGLESAAWLLREGGRCAVITRYPWERRALREFLVRSPVSMLLSTETIQHDVAHEFCQPQQTMLAVFERASYEDVTALKNLSITPEEVEMSQQRYIMGLDEVQAQQFGYPHRSFTQDMRVSDDEAAEADRRLNRTLSTDRSVMESMREKTRKRGWKLSPGNWKGEGNV